MPVTIAKITSWLLRSGASLLFPATPERRLKVRYRAECSGTMGFRTANACDDPHVNALRSTPAVDFTTSC
eukprot:7965212-Alexandrium_andersonii.AAC.1